MLQTYSYIFHLKLTMDTLDKTLILYEGKEGEILG